jgi:hypothetical protein
MIRFKKLHRMEINKNRLNKVSKSKVKLAKKLLITIIQSLNFLLKK